MRDILLKILDAVLALAPAESTNAGATESNVETRNETPVVEPEVKTTKRGTSK